MTVFVCVTGLLLSAYGILLQFYYSWWRAMPEINERNAGVVEKPFITVIVPARNEAATIGDCMHGILIQDYPADRFELFVVDDHSSDETFAIATKLSADKQHVHVISLPEIPGNRAPKKRAIETAIAQAKGELIVTTDADCNMGKDWLRALAQQFITTKSLFIAAPVKITGGKSLLSKFQSLDFLTMQGITAAAVYKGFHNMCNGANLAYTKSAFVEVGGFAGVDNIASGDDMLLMQKIVSLHPTRASFLKSADAIVSTRPANGWKNFFRQRSRWASKAGHYQQASIMRVLILVYVLNFCSLLFLPLALFHPIAFTYFIAICIVKFLFEISFVRSVAKFFSLQGLLPWLLFLQPLHMLYIVVAGFAGQTGSYDWKGRRLK